MFSTWFSIGLNCLTVCRSIWIFCVFTIWIISLYIFSVRTITITLDCRRSGIILIDVIYNTIICYSRKTSIPPGFLWWYIRIWWYIRMVMGIIIVSPIMRWMPPIIIVIMMIVVAVIIIIRIAIVGTYPWIISPVYTAAGIFINLTTGTIIIIDIFFCNYNWINCIMGRMIFFLVNIIRWRIENSITPP